MHWSLAHTPVFFALPLLGAGCVPGELLKATNDFATAAQSATSQISSATGIVRNLCHIQAQLAFLTELAYNQTKYTDWSSYYCGATPSGSSPPPGVKAPTWSAWCDGFAPADDAFGKISTAIGAYGAALGAAAQTRSLTSTDIVGVTSAVADDVARISPWAKNYQTQLEGIGTPLQEIANGLVADWVGAKIQQVVDQADAPIQLSIKKLVGFLAVVQTEMLVAAESSRRQLLEQQSKERLTLALVDITLSERFDAYQQRLASYSAALVKLGAAHSALKRSWDEGSGDASLSEAAAVGAMATDIAKAVYAFGTPTGGK